MGGTRPWSKLIVCAYLLPPVYTQTSRGPLRSMGGGTVLLGLFSLLPLIEWLGLVQALTPTALVMLLLEFGLSREKEEKWKEVKLSKIQSIQNKKRKSDFQTGLITLLASYQGGYAFWFLCRWANCFPSGGHGSHHDTCSELWGECWLCSSHTGEGQKTQFL